MYKCLLCAYLTIIHTGSVNHRCIQIYHVYTYRYLYLAPYKTISTGVYIHAYAFISISGTVQNNIYSIYAYRNEEMESIIYKHISKRTYTEARQRRIFKQADSVASVDQTRGVRGHESVCVFRVGRWSRI